MKKYKNKIVMISGFLIMLMMAIMSLSDSYASDIVQAIPVSLFGAALFIAGYIADTIDK